MSMSVGIFSNAAPKQQSLLQQGTIGAIGDGNDQLSGLYQSGSGATTSSAAATTTADTVTGSGGTTFGTDTMSALLSLQVENGTTNGASVLNPRPPIDLLNNTNPKPPIVLLNNTDPKPPIVLLNNTDPMPPIVLLNNTDPRPPIDLLNNTPGSGTTIGANSANLLEQWMQLQTKLLSEAASTLSVIA
jgi:hypothetical protein